MLDRGQLANIALRYDTAMARAMLRALGVEAPKRRAGKTANRIDRYAGMGECFSNRRRVRF